MKIFASLWLMFAVAVLAQNPQTQNAPLFAANAKYTNGVAPGYWTTQQAIGALPAVTGLQVNLGPGTANCSGTIATYAGATLTMTASVTNYIYLNTSSSCAPAVKTSAFGSSDIPIATVVAGSSTITSISDDRTPFNAPSSGGGTVSALCPSGSYPNAQCVYAPNGSSGTVIHESVCWNENGTGQVSINVCPAMPTATAQGTDNPPNFLGVCVSNCTTTGWAIVQISGEVSWICDAQVNAPETGGSVMTWVQPSTGTPGECFQPSSVFRYSNENPETNSVVGDAVVSNTGTGTAAIIDLHTEPFPYSIGEDWGVQVPNVSGPVVLGMGFGSPNTTVAHWFQTPSAFTIPWALAGNGFLLNTFGSGENTQGHTFAMIGDEETNTTNNNIVLDYISHGLSNSQGGMFAFFGGNFTLPDPTSGPCNGVIKTDVGGSGSFYIGATTGMYLYTIEGNCSLAAMSNDQAGHIIIFDITGGPGGTGSWVWPGNFVNPPSVSIADGVSTISAFLYDGTNYNCVWGCSSSGGGSSVNVNSSPLSAPNFNSTTPAAPLGDQNCTFQVSGQNVSCYVPASGSSGLSQIAQVIASGSQTSIVFSGIPGTFSNLKLVIRACNLTGTHADDLLMQFNGDTSSHYRWASLSSNNTGDVAMHIASITGDTGGNHWSATEVTIPGYAQSGIGMAATATPAFNIDAPSLTAYGGEWVVEEVPITSITLTFASGEGFQNGSMATLYGMQ